MTKIKTSTLIPPALDWAVAMAAGHRPAHSCGHVFVGGEYGEDEFDPSTDWAQGGPIIEREKIAIDWDYDCWNASTDGHPAYYSAPTPLIAAMRCFVASRFGDEVDVPEELL